MQKILVASFVLLLIGNICVYGVSNDVNDVNELTLKANQGDAEAQVNLGECYAKGEGVKQDYVEAVKWFRKAAEQGNVNAQYNLGLCYYNGYGVKQDDVEAVKWFRKAAEQGDAKTMQNLSIGFVRLLSRDMQWLNIILGSVMLKAKE